MARPGVELSGRSVGSLIERLLPLACLIALSTWGSVSLAGMAGAGEALQSGDILRAGRLERPASLHEIQPSDMTLWSAVRISAWRDSLVHAAPQPLAILRIPRIRLEVAVLPGTDDFSLNRGVGHIEDTALPGTGGNSGIAGHRDGFFRGLKDVASGDAIELETANGRQMYRVQRTWIVEPADVSVLDPTPAGSLTLVTCYPFYFVGSAPQRFIVRAARIDE